MKKSEDEKQVSRRGLLAGAGRIAVAAGIAAVPGIISNARASEPKFPWGYKKIDPARAGKIAYEEYYKKYCCYGAASGILRPLQKDFGEPYTLFPLEAMIWGHGGAVGWGTLCGSLNGAGTVVSLLAGRDGEQIISDVLNWYAETRLPIYKPSEPRAWVRQSNKSKSTLCHVSVGKWMRKEGVTFNSPVTRERCARITADVAIKTVELLNDWVDGKYEISRRSQVTMYQMPTDNNCKECHPRWVPDVPEREP